MHNGVTIHHSEALAWLRTQPDNSFDALLTDPPAGISFVGSKWDSDKGGRDSWVAWMTEIMREVLRVLKPGAHGLVWSIPQTSAWTGWALESAGFEIRNCVYHLVGNRMPKNHAIGKNIDKKLGGVRKKTGTKRLGGNAGVSLKDKGGTFGVQVGTAPAIDVDITEAGTEEAAAWEGHGTALRSLVEPWWLIRKPLDGTIVETALKWGTGGINVDACRIAATETLVRPPIHRYDNAVYGWGLGAGVQTEPPGRWPANCVLSETAAADLDASVGNRPSTLTGRADPHARHDNPGDNGGASSFGGGNSAVYADDGGPSRYFFTAKVSTWEREFGCESLPLKGTRRNGHPTLKSVSLTEHLAKMVIPPARKDSLRRCLVPFAGAGSEVIGAMRAGFEEVVGVEADFDGNGFVEIARARVAKWADAPADLTFDEVRKEARRTPRAIPSASEPPAPTSPANDTAQTTLFGKPAA